jgi:hypothetical protein
MKRSMVTFLLILSLLKVDGQTHAEEHYEFDRLHKMMKGYYNRGLYYKAVLYPDSLEGNKYVKADSYYFFARIYALSNEFHKTLFNLEKAVKGGITKIQIEQMYDLDGFRESNLHMIYETNYDKWHQEFLLVEQSLVLDSAYLKEIKKIEATYSQSIKVRRVDGDDVYEVNDSAKYYQTRISVDSMRFYSLVELILERGFPTHALIGEEFFTFSRHLRYDIPDNYDANAKDWLKIKAMIFVEMKNGTIYPFYYAAIEDYICRSRSQPFVYGIINTVYNKFIGTSGKTAQYENPEELNVRRKAVGLCSIQLEMWSEARELPESLKEVNFK